MDKGADISRGKSVAVLLQDAERIARFPGEHIYSVLLENPGHVLGCHLLPFRTGLTTFHHRGSHGGDMPFERRYPITVTKFRISGTVLGTARGRH